MEARALFNNLSLHIYHLVLIMISLRLFIYFVQMFVLIEQWKYILYSVYCMYWRTHDMVGEKARTADLNSEQLSGDQVPVASV